MQSDANNFVIVLTLINFTHGKVVLYRIALQRIQI